MPLIISILMSTLKRKYKRLVSYPLKPNIAGLKWWWKTFLCVCASKGMGCFYHHQVERNVELKPAQ